MTTNSPEVIYLADTGDGVAWCDDPVKYVRGDVYDDLKRQATGLLGMAAPDVSALVEALERISKRASEAECRQAPCSPIQRLFVDIMQQADDALAAHRKGGEV